MRLIKRTGGQSTGPHTWVSVFFFLSFLTTSFLDPAYSYIVFVYVICKSRVCTVTLRLFLCLMFSSLRSFGGGEAVGVSRC